MSWLLDRLNALGKTQADAARALGIPQQRVREIAIGKRRIQQREWEPLARFLEWSVADIHSASGGMQTSSRDAHATVPLQSALGISPLRPVEESVPVWWNRHLGAGLLHIERRVVDVVPRSEFLRYALYSFGLEVMQDDMSPAFERRDVIVVNPDRAVQAGDDVLLVKGYEEKSAAPFDATLRRLVRETDDHWVVRQFSPVKDHKLAKSEWTRALHVAGKRSR
jgi:SOS-response transcriptional repressor LexA